MDFQEKENDVKLRSYCGIVCGLSEMNMGYAL